MKVVQRFESHDLCKDQHWQHHPLEMDLGAQVRWEFSGEH